ncbi:L,D-transpeptidase family protein [Labilibacter marinus]|uniref:L,D-transpeptidase family protein n=1 Tax=Labilibacter marinus TaxID=1477105 RepID=UPI00094FA437|nr:L,D-transpeptidase family protein [Labilibacter marinus]
MLKRGLYLLVLLVLLFACKSKEVVVEIPEVKEKPFVFPEDEIAHHIKKQFESLSDSSLINLYKGNNYKPFWQSDSTIQKGIHWLKNSLYHGLNPDDYHVQKLYSCLKYIRWDSTLNHQKYAELDILLSTSIKKCGANIHYSKLNPKSFHSGWNFEKPHQLPHDSIWINLLKVGKTEELNTYFQPNHELYHALTQELKHILLNPIQNYQAISNPDFLLQQGDSNIYVLPIKRRLLNIHPDSSITMDFNQELSYKVKQLQQKHGLSPDGIVGKQTYYFLNWNQQRYIDAIKVNLERVRWLSDISLGDGVVVNIPAQQANLYHNDSLLISSRVIVGKSKNKTQVFSSNINYLVFNPCWTVPKSIATTTILRGMKRDSSYLQKRNMFLMHNGDEVEIDSLDTSLLTANNFPYVVFQNTDPGNALGQVKFMFKNRYSIYMHDSPQKRLFNKEVRAYSHGCIRLQNALSWSELILKKVDQQSKPISYHLKKGYPEKVYLKKEIPIKIVYLTCWLNPENKQLVFGRDIYSYDYKVLSQLP